MVSLKPPICEPPPDAPPAPPHPVSVRSRAAEAATKRRKRASIVPTLNPNASTRQTSRVNRAQRRNGPEVAIVFEDGVLGALWRQGRRGRWDLWVLGFSVDLEGGSVHGAGLFGAEIQGGVGDI